MIATKGAPPKPMSLPPSTPVDLRIGAYQPCFEIGSGGMASVYIAKELGISGLERTVALKVMHEHLSKQAQFRKRFLDEARVLTHIAHPYVCRVLGFGEEGRRPYMAMEYLVGEPLSRVLRAMKRKEDGLPAGVRARLFARAVADLAEGLHAAHETRDAQGAIMGVVHRDVTPQNLFVLYDGTVRVLDFGIARYRDRHVHTATTGHLLGKLPYMAPEQVMSEPYDRRVDVWALGVVLWELVTLGRLFKRETEMRTMRAVCSDPIPLVSDIVRDVPPGLDDILDRALARNPEDRYRTARELSRALELWLARTGDPVTHADLSEFLNGFFPGSEHERRRWAEEATPGSGVRFTLDENADDDLDTLLIDAPERPRQEAVVEEPTRQATRSSSEPTRSLRTPTALGPMTRPVERRSVVISSHPPIEPTTVVPRRSAVRETQRRRGRTIQALAVVLGIGAVAAVSSTLFMTRPQSLESARPWAAEVGVNATSLLREVRVKPSQAPLLAPGEFLSLLESTEPVGLRRVNDRASRDGVTGSAAGRAVKAPAPPEAELLTGDLLVVSSKPGVPVRVFMGDRLLGTTPVRARLPAGTVALSVQFEDGARIPMSARVAPGGVNMITVGVD